MQCVFSVVLSNSNSNGVIEDENKALYSILACYEAVLSAALEMSKRGHKTISQFSV